MSMNKSKNLFNFKALPRIFQSSSPNTSNFQEEQTPSRRNPQPPLESQETIVTKKTSMWKLMWREFFRKRRFETAEVECLYQRYVLQANLTHLTNLLGLLVATTVVMEIGLLYIAYVEDSFSAPDKNFEDRTITMVCNGICGCIYMGSLCVIYWHSMNEQYMVYISYILVASFLVGEISLSRNSTHIWYTVVFIYITYALLPIRLLDATLSGIMLSFVQFPSDLLYSDQPTIDYFPHYQTIVSNTLILIGMNIMGILTHFPGEMAKRKAFNEIRQFARAKLKIEIETRRQHKLLLSVLPKHLAEEMREDMAKHTTSTRKLYLMTYDPVSIVFADIVGFTAMADQSPAQDVVKILNDLYCSFDKLSEINRCLRIKLLGDCYYCVSGMPRENPFHAQRAVNMGMDMIVAIEEVRDRYKVELYLRVGIHSGVVQCGVLGIKKWQFDVWSSDVTLANQMESGGIPGKVHISIATKNYLGNDYNLEPGNGATREPALRGIETFFVISKRTTEHEKQVLSYMNGRVSRQSKVTVVDTASVARRYKTIDRTHSMFISAVRMENLEREVNKNLYNNINSRSIHHLKNINCRKNLLLFRNNQIERQYNSEPDRTLQSYFVTAFIIFLVIGLVQLVKLPKADMFFVCFSLGMVWMFSVMVLVLARKYEIFPKYLRFVSLKISRNRRVAQTLAITTIFVCYLTTSLPLVILFKTECSAGSFETMKTILFETSYSSTSKEDDICENNFIEYTLLYTILVMVIMGTFQIIVFYQKILVMFIFCAAYAMMVTVANPYKSRTEASYLIFFMVVLLVTFVLLLLIHSQQTEIIQRLDFVWKLQAKSEKEYVQRMQVNNQRLIENILPVHVANFYLEQDRQNNELYHEQIESVCMLFACVTNFSFSENGNISVLHDIISDFDEILSEHHFGALEKIKCTGPVYMAASGLSKDTCNIEAMEHVVKMAEFALRIRDQMKTLNERHNTSYNIKIGMNVGPVVAGVIGASMPQYDIWGNTVNVASRMYSTGTEGEIQVTEDVARVLITTGLYNLKERGSVYVKGKGNMYTYWLKGLKGSESTWSFFQRRSASN